MTCTGSGIDASCGVTADDGYSGGAVTCVPVGLAGTCSTDKDLSQGSCTVGAGSYSFVDYSYSYQIDDFFNKFDANGDSLVTLPELLAEPGPPPFLTCLFNLIVTDNADTDGRWSVAECRGVPPLTRTVSPGNVKESWHPALTSSLSSAICPSVTFIHAHR